MGIYGNIGAFNGLGTPGDTYIITDTRKRARKELQDTALFKKFDIQKFDTPNSPATLAPGDASGVILVPIFDLNFDTKNFQNRQEEFSETSVNRIIDAVDDGDFNWAVFDPITVWKNPQDGKLYVLSGHSRSWDSLKRSITYAKNELEKEKNSLYSSEKWVKQAEERLKDAIKIYKYNCNFYGVKNEYENLGKTANNALYNDNSIIDCRGLKPTYKILNDYSAFFENAKQNTSFAGFGLDDTLKLIADTCRKHYKECSKIAAHLKGDCKLQSAFNLWHWLRHNIRYEYDREGREEVRAPLRTWADRARGVDCDCLSVFAWCVLKCMGYDPVFELVAFRNKPQFSHIFVNLDGIVVDRVWFIFNSRPPLVTKNKIYKVDLFNSLGKLF